MTRKQKLIFVNNYRDKEKGLKAVHDLARCCGHELATVEHGTRNLVEAVTTIEPSLVFLSGSEYLLSRPGTREAFKEQIDLVRKAHFPILGICFGHQLIGTAFGAGMIDLGHRVRRFEKVEVLDHNPLFQGLPSTITVAESHRQALDKVPEGFTCLAQSSTSDIEAICHRSLPIYGLQFHPERADDAHPHGQTLLRNLVQLATIA